MTPSLPDTGLELFSLRRSQVIGRESLRDKLWERLRHVQTNATPQAVILRGPEGVGKRRIAEWLSVRAHEVGAATILQAHHSPNAGNADGLAPMVLRHLRCTGLPRADVQRRIMALLHHENEDVEEATALCDYLLPPTHDGPDEQASTIRLFSVTERNLVLARHLERIAMERAAILRLDDVQWGHESLDFVLWLLGRNRCAFLLVMTVSEEVLSERVVESMIIEDLMESPNVTVIDVPPMSQESHAALVQSMICLEPGLAHLVQTRTAGNPMFTIQLVQSWVDKGLLTPTPKGYALASGASKVMPESIAEVWAERIKQMLQDRSKEDIASLELAAVLGQEVDREEWHTACRLAGIQPSPSLLQDLMRDRFIKPLDERDTEAGWLFIHGMLREALEQHAREHDRYQSHHRHCVALLRSTGRLGSRLARHLREAGDLHGSLGPIRKAVELHLAAGDDRASDAALIEWRDTLRSMGVPESSPAWIEPALIECYVSLLRGDLTTADRVARRQGEIAREELLNGVLCQCLTIRGQIANDRGQYHQALALLDEAIAAYDDLSRPDLWARCQLNRASAYRALANYVQADRAYREAELAFLNQDELIQAAHCMLGRAHIARRQGESEEAEALIAAARKELEQEGTRAGVAATLHAEAEVHRMRGDLDEAERAYRDARERYAHIGSPKAVWVELDLSSVLLARDSFLEAHLLLTRALEAAMAQGRRVLELKARINLLSCAAQQRDWPDWDHHVQQIKKTISETGVADIDVALQISIASDLARAGGQLKRASDMLRLAKAQWLAMGREDRAAELSEMIDALSEITSSWH